MEIKGNPNPSELIGAAESVGSNTGHCKRRLSTESSNSDTEASGSCNFEPVKRPRKVLKKMTGPSHELGWQETRTLNHEEPETQRSARIDVDLSPTNIKPLLEEAAKVVNATYMSAKCEANFCFSISECEIIENGLSLNHNIRMPCNEVKRNLESLYFSFRDYCGEMKRGKTGFSFYWETGCVYTPNNHESHDPIVSNLHQFQRRWNEVISNFHELKGVYPFVWDKYFKDIAQKRSGSSMQSRSSKRSRGSSSSIKNFRSDFGLVMNRIRLLFGTGDGKHISKGLAKSVRTFYGSYMDSVVFLALNDDEAKEDFISKIGGKDALTELGCYTIW